MNYAVHQLELLRGQECDGLLVHSADGWMINVLRHGQLVTSIPLASEEAGYLAQTLDEYSVPRPLEFFSVALQQGYLGTLSN